jgi:hypothetical protein
MDVRLLALLFFFVSCMPTTQVARTNSASTSTNNGSGTTPTTNIPASATTWNYLGANSTGITLNSSNLNTAYIAGSVAETYLSTTTNFSNADYCVSTRFNLGATTYELRARAVPISYYDFTAKRTVRIFRVDFPDVTNSTSLCGGSLRVQDSSGTYQIEPSSVTPGFDASLICPSCTSALTSSSVRLFRKGMFLDQVPSALLNVSSLSLTVNPNNNTTGNTTCSQSACVSRGYDCCVENQCVDDGSTRPSAQSLYPSQLATANQERIQNPLSFINYPHLYYICPSSVPTTTGGSSGGTNPSYDAGLEQLKKDYACIQNIKAQAKVTPFNSELVDRLTATPAYTPATDCLTASSQTSQTFHFKNVITRLYETCGCAETEFPRMISMCPAYDYVVTTSTNGVPTQIDCLSPQTGGATLPLQQTVNLNSRSAPHRFFDASGEEKVITSATTQEGQPFKYLDDQGLVPDQKDFSMNAILGQMSVSLDKALPAQTVNLNLDQVYLITTTSGYFTPCPSCGKDSWINSFTAFPGSSLGTGVQAVGHTTSRDTLSNNTTLGNYEDTIFGRACWIPPTMLPFSHSQRSTNVDQRRDRLTTQAALFANGYQRDWFGFNKGALIGSFDGVSWFAIGKARIVRSKSKKLFLAINAPFADLSAPGTQVVNIQAYDGLTQATQVDYDPQYHLTHPLQNAAANCQANHMCETDTDCVTKLGWEYACADVKDVKTLWPSFDSEGKELTSTTTINSLGQTVTVGAATLTIDKILLQQKFPSASSKRCIYRGAGSLCMRNPTALADLNKKKILTCAPNFFCAGVSTSSQFNRKVSRYSAPVSELPVARNHLFGKDANILGRPLNYLASESLTGQIASTLNENLATFEPTASGMTGLCQPGKLLPETSNENTVYNPFIQHQLSDTQKRTDFISQIGSCNSTLFTPNRHSSCPVIGADENYTAFASASLPTDYLKLASSQNACGLESLASVSGISGANADSLSNDSPFKTIEAKTLNSQIILDKTLVRDACLRRAGAACHTDLDCSPNKMHADQVDLYSLDFFGNEAERKYHSQYLSCSQGDPKPAATDGAAYTDYDMTQNRCCREIGSDLTTFTANVPVTGTNPATYDPDSEGLVIALTPGTVPNNPKRYSRFSNVENIGSADRPVLSASQIGGVTAKVNAKNQWKTLSETNSETCCGGGWIRKFADGGHDWTKRNRVIYDVSNFRCLNSRSVLLTDPSVTANQYGGASPQSLVDQDYGDYCKDGVGLKGSCAQNSFDQSQNIIKPVADNYGYFKINTVSPSYSGTNINNFFNPRSADADPATFVDYSTTSGRRNITIKLPSFLPTTSFDSHGGRSVFMVNQSASTIVTCSPATLSDVTSSTSTSANCGGSNCCYELNTTSRILKVVRGSGNTSLNNTRAGVVLSDGTTDGSKPTPYEQINGTREAGFDGTTFTARRRKPGSSYFYLRRFGRLELSGIPQVTHEPILCADNRQKVVPGLYSSPNNLFSSIFPSTFLKEDDDYTDATRPPGATQDVVNFRALATDPVFSSNDFMCCAPLGKTVNTPGRCCSNFGTLVTGSTNKYTCGLPAGTDLMVYFNKFVSNEGVGTDKPGGGLVDADFDASTGEPLFSSSVNGKLNDLGVAFCKNKKVRQGGAFGLYEPEPQGSDTNLSSRIYNLVDSSRDNGQNSNAGTTVTTGYAAFQDGFRWNHHLYCAD